MRDFQFPGRSPVFATKAAAASSHPLASLTAIEILKAGGNAMDGAIAAAALLAVIEPHMTGLGGDAFALIAKPDGKIEAYNGNGAAARLAEPGYFRDRGMTEIDADSIHAVTIPGAVEAWCRLSESHGRLGIDRLLAPAIHYAETGFAIASRIAADWAEAEERLGRNPAASALYLRQGRAPSEGDLFRLPKLAATLREIAAKGRIGFYEGWVAEDIAAALAAEGSLLRPEDFAAHRGDFLAPISTRYRGFEIWQCPPPGQGLTPLLMLNVLSQRSDIGGGPIAADRLHIETEIAKLAYRQRNAFIADPAFADVPVAALLSERHAADLAKLIAPDRVLDIHLLARDFPRHPDTIYLCVVDRDGLAVSFINSLYFAFGSARAAPRSGVLMQNRGACFRLDPDHPNCIGPGKKSLHTIIPAMVTRAGRPVMPFGVMGGDYQPVGQFHVLTNMLDFGLDPQAALDCPRCFFEDGRLHLERGIPAETAKDLARHGHAIAWSAEPLGGGQAIWIDEARGVLIAGSDPRKDGCALGY